MKPTDVLAGRYELLAPIGGTARATVFHARDLRQRQPVIIKCFEPARLPAGALAKYAAAITALKRSDIAGAVLPLELVTTGATPFAIFAPRVGESLATAMARRELHSWARATDIIAGCAKVLAATTTATGLHHRALKPSNLWLAPTGEVSLLDLGIAELGVLAVPPRDGPLFIEYRAPEQLDGGPGDGRSDVFTLGVLLHELATGTHPFSGSSAFQVARQLLVRAPLPMAALTRDMSPGGAREAEKLLTRALARTPADRFDSAQEFLHALQFASRVIGTPNQKPIAEVPAPLPTPALNQLAADDPSTVMQVPVKSVPRPQIPARPSEPIPPVAAAPPTPEPAPTPPPADERTEYVPVQPRRPTPEREPTPLEPILEQSPRAPNPAPSQRPLDEYTEVLPAQPARAPTRPARVDIADESATVEFRSLNIARPGDARNSADTEDAPTMLHAALAVPFVRAQKPTAESTLLIPSDPQPTAESTLLLPSDPPPTAESTLLLPSAPSPAVTRPSATPRAQTTLITLSMLAVILVVVGLLLARQ